MCIACACVCAFADVCECVLRDLKTRTCMHEFVCIMCVCVCVHFCVSVCRVGQDCIYTLYIHTVYDRTFGDFPAQNTIYAPYIYGSGQPYTPYKIAALLPALPAIQFCTPTLKQMCTHHHAHNQPPTYPENDTHTYIHTHKPTL